MARVTLEDKWWTDPRRSALIEKIHSELIVDGIAVKLFRVAQDYWKNSRGGIPFQIFTLIPNWQLVVQVGLVIVRDPLGSVAASFDPVKGSFEFRSEISFENMFAFVRGSSDYLDWLRAHKDNAVEAGKKSAESRKKTNGSAQPKGNKTRTKTEPKTTNVEPSVSPSSSASSSDSDSSFDFESIYSHYPERSGDTKKKTGITSLEKKITSQEKFDQALVAVKNYAEHCTAENKIGTSFVKQFSTFFGKDDIWLEYVNYQAPLVPQATNSKNTHNRAEHRTQANRAAGEAYLNSIQGEQDES